MGVVLDGCVEVIEYIVAHSEEINTIAARLGVRKEKNAEELIRGVAVRLRLEHLDHLQDKDDGEVFSEVIMAMGLPATGTLAIDMRTLGQYIGSPVVYSLGCVEDNTARSGMSTISLRNIDDR